MNFKKFNIFMIFQAGIYTFFRASSVLVSLYIFGLIGRRLDAYDATQVYFVMFILGFCISSGRACSQIGASIKNNNRLSLRFNDVSRGLGIIKIVVFPLAAFGGIQIFMNTQDFWLSIVSFLLVAFCIPNLDLVRSLLSKNSIFPANFLAGSLLVVFAIYYFDINDKILFVWVLTLQWLFVAISNLFIFNFILKSKIIKDFSNLYAIVVFSFFDGLIINSPFFGFLDAKSNIATELSISTRIFLASLPILPLVIHFSNTPSFLKFCIKIKFDQKLVMFLFLISIGFLSGLLFCLIYFWYMGSDFSFNSLLFYFLLYLSFSYYIPRLRFSLYDRSDFYLISFKITSLLILYFLLFGLFKYFSLITSLFIVVLQSFAFIVAAYILSGNLIRK